MLRPPGHSCPQRQKEGQELTPYILSPASSDPKPTFPPVLHSRGVKCLLCAWVQIPTCGTFLPLRAPISCSDPLPISRSDPLLHMLTQQTSNLVSNNISQPHYTSQACHLHSNEWAINKVNSLRHCCRVQGLEESYHIFG